MAVEKQDIEEVAKALGAKFEEFKAKNDAKFEAISAEKAQLSAQLETLNAKLTELDQMKAGLEEELKSAKRPGVAGGKATSEHKAAFMRFVRKGDDHGLAELQQKALSVGTDADGGYAVPEELDRALLEIARQEVTMRQVANVIAVSTGDYKKLVNLGGAASGWVGETDARPATGTPALAQITPFMGEIYGNPQSTQTMLDDAMFDVEGWLAAELQQEFSEQEELAFTSGNGTNKPKGFLAYSTATTGDAVRAFGTLQHIVSGAAADLTADAVMQLVYTLRKAYRNGAMYMLNNNTLFKVRTLKDGENNYLWRPGLELGQPSTLCGYGVAENEEMPDVAADAMAIAFGNFKRGYTIVDRFGTRVLRDPFTNEPYVGFYTTKRVGGMVSDSNAIKLLKIAAA